MDAATLLSFLTPYLPALINQEKTTAEQIRNQLGEVDEQRAIALWEKLRPPIAASAAAWAAATQVAARPQSEVWRAALQEELDRLLQEDPTLAAAIVALLPPDAPAPTAGTHIRQQVSGNQNQVIGQVTGGTVFGTVQGHVGSGSTASPKSTSDSSAPRKTILVLAANPRGTSRLRLDQEVRDLQTGLERARQRDRFRLEQRWAVTATELRRALLEYKPQIVHFCGHGAGSEARGGEAQPTRKLIPVDAADAPEGLLLEDETGQPKRVSGAALATLFGLFAEHIECVVLNACYSEVQAMAIAEHIPCVIGMNNAIGDQAAIAFAVGFYDALLAGESVDFAYRLGCNAIQLAGIPEELTPVLKRK